MMFITKNTMKNVFILLIFFFLLTFLIQQVPSNDLSTHLNRLIANNLKDDLHLIEVTNTCPYVSSACYYFHSKYAYVEHFKNIEPVEQLNDGDLVFVTTNLLEEFFTKIFKKINKKIILISHHDDDSTNKSHEIYLNDSKLIISFYYQLNKIPIT